MEKKSSDQVVRLLSPIYDEHGPPDRLQRDRGPLQDLKEKCAFSGNTLKSK